MSFAHSPRLLLLLAVVALGAIYAVLQVARKGYAVRFTNLDLLDSVAPKRPGWRRHVVAATFLAAIVLQVVAFAGPARNTEVPRERATVMMAIDTSLSMEATDVSPSRLEGAKIAAKAFLDKVPPKINIGLVSFNRTVSLQVAPTTDRTAVAKAIDALKLGEGTAIGEAIYSSLDALNQVPADADGTKPPAAIVLMSDGKTTSGRPDAQASAAAKTAGVPVSTIAFGTQTGSIVLPQDGQVIPVPVDESALRRIAEDTGGKSFGAQSTAELTSVYQSLGSSVGYETKLTDITPWFVGFALLLALLTAALSLRWFSRLP
jgi:Ca-activated chloride channel family protein